MCLRRACRCPQLIPSLRGHEKLRLPSARENFAGAAAGHNWADLWPPDRCPPGQKEKERANPMAVPMLLRQSMSRFGAEQQSPLGPSEKLRLPSPRELNRNGEEKCQCHAHPARSQASDRGVYQGQSAPGAPPQRFEDHEASLARSNQEVSDRDTAPMRAPRRQRQIRD